jgi:flagellar hook-basal body complex protein FliE
MSLPVDAITAARIAPISAEPRGAAEPAGASFGDALVGAIERAAGAERNAEATATAFASGDPNVGIHEAVLAASVAEVQVKFAVTMTSRAIEAYRELLNTPV